ncbi:hypothetical protein L1987_57990 [Smallanthus sonchifolius]|uniref:Uncharacterized protein n=1 Tax=Smallanthus sonchifolius TaxID=185202 RepID=A0ACB9DDZ7_9ASTR|nr:hypothetical protein L1987_57990 [Smallanthus sonchifolius]
MPTGSSETVKHASSSAAGRPGPPARTPILPMKTAPNKKPSKIYERRSSLKNFKIILKNFKIILLVPGFINAAGFSGSPRNSNPKEILLPILLDFPLLALNPVVCARCHGLRKYGKVKDQTVENLLPDFDLDHTVGRMLNSVTGTRVVVVMVVDAVDFDGSFPRKVAELVSNTIDVNSRA